jgi:hypothetical protein
LPHLRTVQSQRRPDGSVDVSVEDHRAGDAFHVRARDLRAALVHFQDQRRFVLPQGLDTASLDVLMASLRVSKGEDAS